MAETPRKPDVRQLAEQDSAELRFPGGGRRDFRVYFTPDVHGQVWQHACENTAVEIGGVLVGNWQHDAGGPYVVISEFIRCDAAASKSGEVTFTHEAWNVINREMDTRLANLRIVGWYHSHPAFGVFLSDRDNFIQDHFFSNPGQIAYVVDPIAKTEGVFVWRDGRPTLSPHYWVGDRVLAGAERAREAEPDAKTSAPGRAESSPGGASELASLLPSLRIMLLCLAVFLIGYLLAGVRSGWEQRMLVEGTVAHYGIWKGLRPGLREALDAAGSNLEMISAAVSLLAKEHVELAGEAAAEKRGEWDQVRDALRRQRLFLAQVNDRYSLTPEESAAVERLIVAKEAELQRVTDNPAAGAAGRSAKEVEKPSPADKGKEPEKKEPEKKDTGSQPGSK